MRQNFPARIKVAAFKRANKACELCGAHLTVGKFAYDHINPDGLTGEPTLENCMCVCLPCHSEKTRFVDVPAIDKAKRREAKHLGAYRSKSPLPGGKASAWKRKVNGEIVRRYDD